MGNGLQVIHHGLKRGTLALGLFLLGYCLVAQEIPRLINFTPQQYMAHNQNWSMVQHESGAMFFGNSGGLLLYDGARWKSFPTPGGQIIRSVAKDTAGRIFMGGYATLGYWQNTANEGLKYYSLIDKVEVDRIKNEEIWHFLPTDRGLFFQSFSMIYRFYEGKIEAIKPPSNIMFIRQVGNKVLVPVIQDGLYEYTKEGEFDFIKGSEFLKQKRVASILPHDGGGYLIGTQSDGLFLYKNGVFTKWGYSLGEQLQQYQLNKGLRLSNGNYVFGTILNGIFIADRRGNLLYHINQENGLQNNTVLALYESKGNNLWVGLDKGISLVKVNTALSFYLDKQGAIGTVYTAIQHEGRLYVGTNQGIFHKPYPNEEGLPFQLIEGSQGQVWNFRLFGSELLCAHNTGTLKIEGLQAKPIYSNTGVYDVIKVPGVSDYLLQTTYIGLGLLKKASNGAWEFAGNIEGYGAPTKEAAFGQDSMLWLAHARKGIACLRLSDSLDKVRPLQWSTTAGLPPLSEIKARLEVVDGKVYFLTDSLTMAFDQQEQKVVKLDKQDSLKSLSLDDSWVVATDGTLFRIKPQHLLLYYQNNWVQLQASLLPGDESVMKLNDTTFFLGTAEGYALLNTNKIDQLNGPAGFAPYITEVSTSGKTTYPFLERGGAKEYALPASERSIRLSYAYPFFADRVDMQYRLLGFQEVWSAPSKTASKEYTNLPPGQYEFQARCALSPGVASFVFTVEPRWYQTWWAALLFAAILFLLGRFFWRLHNKRLAEQRRELQIDKERELQRQRIESRNDRLRSEIENKNRKLADSTMNLIRKNEMLIKLKEELELLKKNAGNQQTKPLINKLLRQIDSHISSEDDWEVFESNFNQLHDQFFRRLKEDYPSLTPGDLRLAAYLKMNLSSKEIAPLLNISLRGVENKRYRLRKKMDLEADINLTEYLMQF